MLFTTDRNRKHHNRWHHRHFTTGMIISCISICKLLYEYLFGDHCLSPVITWSYQNYYQACRTYRTAGKLYTLLPICNVNPATICERTSILSFKGSTYLCMYYDVIDAKTPKADDAGFLVENQKRGFVTIVSYAQLASNLFA